MLDSRACNFPNRLLRRPPNAVPFPPQHKTAEDARDANHTLMSLQPDRH
jgi:hypothetical protein